MKLDADVRPFVVAMAKAEAAAKKLRDSLGKSASIQVNADTTGAVAQLRSLQSEVDKLSRSRATVRAEVDAAQAQAEVADLRRRMEELSSRRIGIDLDAGAAQSELSSIQRDLQRLNATSADPKVRLDSATALAELRTVQAEMSRVDGKSARVKVDADIGGALASIAMVGAALAALPSAVSIGVGVAGIGAAFGVAAAGAAAFGAVAGPSLGRINEALKEQTSAAGGAGAATKSAGQAAADAASKSLQLAQAQDRVADSAQGVKDAQRAVRDAVADVGRAQSDAARAAEDAADRQAQAASRIADAERTVQDAHRATQRAIEDLTRAREAAQERIEDLALATERGALSEERAQLSIQRAQADLARVNADPKASSLDRSDADLRLREAELSLKEIQERNGDLTKEREESDKKGVEGSAEVVAAKERILDAQRAEADAERSLADARAESARAARDGAREVADAQSKIADAQRKVADAQQAVIKAQRDQLRATQALKVEQLQQAAATDKAGSAASSAATKMSKLSDAEQALAKKIKSFQDDYIAWQQSLQPDVFPVIEKGLGVLRVGMERATPLVKGGAEGLGRFADAAKKALQSKEWTDFFDDLGKRAPDAIAGLGDSAINVADGLRGIIEAFLPYTGPLTDWVEDITQGFDDWGTGLKDSPEFHDFLEYAKENGPKVVEIVKNIAEFVGNVAEAGAGIGPGVLDFLVTLSDELASMSPEQIEAIATGVGLIFAAVKIGATLKVGALVLLAQVLGEMSPEQIKALAVAIGLTVVAVKGYHAVSGAASWFQSLSGGIDKAGKAAGGAQGKISALGGAFGKGGLIAAAVAGTALAMDSLVDAVAGLNPSLDGLSKGLASFGKGGAPATELLDQLGPKLSGVGSAMETFEESASRLASDNPFAEAANGVAGFIDSFDLVTLDNGKQAIGNIDKALTDMVAKGQGDQAAGAFNRLAAQAAAAGVPVDKLRELFPELAASLDGSIPRTGDMATAMSTLKVEVDPTAVAMERFNSSLDIYNAKTDAARMTLELRDAFNEAKKAIEEAGGKLEITAGMTDKQKDAVIRARDQFGGYIEKVQAAAKAAGEMAGKTGEAAVKSDEAKEAILRQLPQLATLAGKSGEAKESVLKLAEAYGISRSDAEKAMKSAADFQEVLDKFKNKNIYIKLGLNTDAAIASFEAFVKRVGDRSLAVALTAKQEMKARSGGIFAYAAGGMQRFASGGRSTPPNVTASPTILYGEGADQEAFIPYESRYRDRAVALLGQVANDFGLQLNNQQAAQGLSDLSVTIDGSGLEIVDGLTGVMGSLESTMGQAGSLTSSIDGVGTASAAMTAATTAGAAQIGDSAERMGTVTSDAVILMADTTSKSTSELSAQVANLTVALNEAKSVAAAAAAASKSSATSGGSSGGTGYSLTKGTIPLKADPLEGNSVAGSYGTGGASYVTTAPLYSTGGPINASTVSAPVQSSSSSSGSSSTEPTQGTSGSWGREGAQNGPAVVIQNQTINSDVDANLFAESVAMKVRARGR